MKVRKKWSDRSIINLPITLSKSCIRLNHSLYYVNNVNGFKRALINFTQSDGDDLDGYYKSRISRKPEGYPCLVCLFDDTGESGILSVNSLKVELNLDFDINYTPKKLYTTSVITDRLVNGYEIRDKMSQYRMLYLSKIDKSIVTLFEYVPRPGTNPEDGDSVKKFSKFEMKDLLKLFKSGEFIFTADEV